MNTAPICAKSPLQRVNRLFSKIKDMEITKTFFDGIVLMKPRLFPDNRGYFLETHHARKYTAQGLSETFVQDNLAHSKKGVLRGLHYQHPRPQGKLIFVVQGEIFDVVVDIRKDSPTFGKWFGVVLSASNHMQLYIAPGFAHGYCVISDTSDVFYKCTDFYNPEYEQTLMWNDPAIGIEWPIKNPSISEKDARGKLLREAILPG